MRSYGELKSDILHLASHCDFLRPATTDDRTYTRFANPPQLDQSDLDNGMYWCVNNAMDAVFGKDVIDKHLLTGCYGMEYVLRWLDKAREHVTWDRNSDLLLIVKLKNIRKKLIGES